MRINAGSGQRPFAKPWVNIDCNPHWVPDLICRMEAIPFNDSTVEMIVSHHTIEHLGCGGANAFLKEAHRLLRIGGSLLVFVPDLRALAQRYLLRNIDMYTYCVNLFGAYMGNEEDRHRWGYDGDSLRALLKGAAPWEEVKAFDWRPIEGADIARDWWILGMEAVK